MECSRRKLLILGVVAMLAIPLARCGPGGDVPPPDPEDDPTARGKPVKFRLLTARWDYDPSVAAVFELWEDGNLFDTTTAHELQFQRRLDNTTKCYKVRALVNGAYSDFTSDVCVQLSR